MAAGADLGGTVGLHGDALFSVWRLAWIAHQLPRDPSALFDANIFWPQRHTLAFSDAILLPGAVLAPFHWLGAPPLVVYNVFLLATYVLCGAGLSALVRRLTGSWPAGLLAGVSFAFCTHRLEHFERLELLTSFWMPWCLLALHKGLSPSPRLREEHSAPSPRLRGGGWGEGRRKWLLLASLLAAAQILTGIYHGIFLLTFIAVFVPMLCWRDPRRIPAALAMALILPALVLAVYSRPYLANRRTVGERPIAEVQAYSATPANFLASHPTNRLYGRWTSRLGGGERFLFPGLVALLLAMASFWPPVRGVTWAYLGGLVLAVLLTLGLNGPLYPWLYEYHAAVPRPAGGVTCVRAGQPVAERPRRHRGHARAGERRASGDAGDVLPAAAHPLAGRVRGRGSAAAAGAAVTLASLAGESGSPDRLRVADDAAGAARFERRHALHVLLDVSLAATGERLQRVLPSALSQSHRRRGAVPGDEAIGYLKRYGVTLVIVHGAGPEDARYHDAVAVLRTRADMRELPADPHDPITVSVFLLTR